MSNRFGKFYLNDTYRSLKTDFNSITQGSSSISAFTQKLLDEVDVLRFLGVSKSDDEITWTLYNGLNHGEARNYAFTNRQGTMH
jgi:hypothetical protein